MYESSLGGDKIDSECCYFFTLAEMEGEEFK